MGRETLEAKRRRAAQVLEALGAEMPEVRIQLDYRTPLELMVAVMLSAQCTDKRVNLVTPALFERFPDAQAYAAVKPEVVEPFIQTCGLFRAKAKNIVLAAKALVAQHGGQVPTSRQALEQLPGVGRKTAGVVCIHLGGDAAFPVDTHVKRLAGRLDFSRQLHPDKIEHDLQALLPPEKWFSGHQLLVWHGRRTCFARSPACERCTVAQLCPRRGVRAGAGERGATKARGQAT